MTARIVNFVFLRRSAKNMAARLKGRAKRLRVLLLSLYFSFMDFYKLITILYCLELRICTTSKSVFLVHISTLTRNWFGVKMSRQTWKFAIYFLDFRQHSPARISVRDVTVVRRLPKLLHNEPTCSTLVCLEQMIIANLT